MEVTRRFPVENCPKKVIFVRLLRFRPSDDVVAVTDVTARLRKSNFVIEGDTSGKVEKTIF